MPRRLILAVLSSLLGFVVAELALHLVLTTAAARDRLRLASPEGARLSVLLGRDHAARWMGPDGVGPVVHDRELGWRNRPGAHPLPYGTVDADGARRGLPQPEDAPHVVVLGDSFAYGYGVPDDETLGAALHRRTGARVSTWAVPGWSHEQMGRAWVRDGQGWKADLVVLVLVQPDVSRNGIPATDYLKPFATLHGDGLRWHGLPVPAPSSLHPPVFMTPALLRAVLDRPAPTRERIALASALVGPLARQIRRHSRLVVVSSPTPHEAPFHTGEASSAPTAPGQPVFDAACAIADGCLGAGSLVHAALRRTGDDGVRDGHWSGVVHEAIAEGLAPLIGKALERPAAHPHHTP